MRLPDRVALYGTLVAAVVIAAGGVSILQPSRSGRGDLAQLSREQPVVQAVDLSLLAPKLREAVGKARDDGLRHAGKELESLHAELMLKVDQRLLDWYFRYWTQQRLGLSYALSSGKGWLLGLFVETDPDHAGKELGREIAREFELRVMPTPVLDERLQIIARQSVAVFVASLQAELQALPKQYEIPPAQWEGYLERISFMVGDTEGSRSVPLTLKALAGAVAWSGAGAAAALAPHVTALFSQRLAVAAASGASGALSGSVARRAATSLGRQAAARGAAIGAASWGGALTGGAAVAALVAWEAFDHTRTVAENRPLLRNNIDQLLRLYEQGLVEPPGMIGAILHDMERRIAAGIPG